MYVGAGFEMVGRPMTGRPFCGSRRVRLGDCSPGGRLRLDAAARYLQDLSDDDTRDAGLAQMTWVVRRTVIDVMSFPTYLESLDMVTWCSGLGSRWAERRVDLGAYVSAWHICVMPTNNGRYGSYAHEVGTAKGPGGRWRAPVHRARPWLPVASSSVRHEHQFHE